MKKRNNSLIQKDMSKCFVCGCKNNLHIHEVFHGSANRKKSIEYDCYVALCANHHNISDEGVHYNKELDTYLKVLCQEAFEKKYSHKKFMEVFHKNYL